MQQKNISNNGSSHQYSAISVVVMDITSLLS
jgi:hypothetical protein